MFEVSEVYIRSGVNTQKNQPQNTKKYSSLVDQAIVCDIGKHVMKSMSRFISSCILMIYEVP